MALSNERHRKEKSKKNKIMINLTTIQDILSYSDRLKAERDALFDPFTGEGSVGERFELQLSDFYLSRQWLPVEMANETIVIKLIELGSVRKFIEWLGEAYTEESHDTFVQSWIKLRSKYDFPFWAATLAKIKNKKGGKNIAFILNFAQRFLLAELEDMRKKDIPIRIILLKARQWGGSTLIQLYIAWLQLLHREGWYSSIVAQDKSTSYKIMEMFSKLLTEYPPWMIGLKTDAPLDFGAYGRSANDFIVKQSTNVVRDSVISIGSVLAPQSIRGGDIACFHASEVGVWSETAQWNPENIIRSVAGSILDVPLTLIAFESTANGTGNYFHKEWLRAKLPDGDENKSQMRPVFIPWFLINLYAKRFKTEKEKERFASWLLVNKDSEKPVGAPDAGQYYWWLLEKGACLENINWYISKRRTFNDHADMAAEFPSDDVEAFKHSGQRVFNQYQVEELRKNCCKPEWIGDIQGKDVRGKKSLVGIKFYDDKNGNLKIWEMPDISQRVANRYLIVVDVGGRSKGADFSDIFVLDRYWMIYGGVPEVVAEWHGHTDHDLLAWKAAQIARFYNDGLLVIESNTMETDNTDGDHTEYILDKISWEYPNLYTRTDADKIVEGKATRWGFHVNRSTKPMIINEAVRVIREKAYVERENDACDEYLQYEKKPNGSFGAVLGYHDDRLMARCIALYVCFNDMELPKLIIKEEAIKPNKIIKSTMTL